MRLSQAIACLLAGIADLAKHCHLSPPVEVLNKIEYGARNVPTRSLSDKRTISCSKRPVRLTEGMPKQIQPAATRAIKSSGLDSALRNVYG